MSKLASSFKLMVTLVLKKSTILMDKPFFWAQCFIKVVKKAKIRNQYNQVLHLTQEPYGKVTKTQENITHKRAKRSAFSQQVTLRLQGTDNTV